MKVKRNPANFRLTVRDWGLTMGLKGDSQGDYRGVAIQCFFSDEATSPPIYFMAALRAVVLGCALTFVLSEPVLGCIVEGAIDVANRTVQESFDFQATVGMWDLRPHFGYGSVTVGATHD